MLNKTHWIDAYPDYKTKFNDLVSAVALVIGKDVDQEKEQVFLPTRNRHHDKAIKIGVGVALVVALIVVMFPLLIKKTHTFVYDGQGLHVREKGLTVLQEESLSTILDNMVLVEGGTFAMGNTPEMADFLTEQDSLSSIVHEVELDHFYISKFEVTQKQWRAFFPTKGRCIADGDEIAMDMLSWEDAKFFADTLASITGLQFSLPTEAQWEFVARGGTKSHKFIFSGNDDPTEVGWTSFDELSSAHKVGGKRYNELEIYDMTGNVSEWCLDYFGIYSTEKQTNPQGPSKGMNRVLRGGDYRMDNLYDMKTCTRYFDSPFVNRRGAGLRLVININEQ